MGLAQAIKELQNRKIRRDPLCKFRIIFEDVLQTKGPIVRCAGAEFPYRFEYQGASVGLVQTPLTERCFLALAQAMKLGLGGSPSGPAGTGKTESVKALGAILGRLVLVFNCDEGNNTTVVSPKSISATTYLCLLELLAYLQLVIPMRALLGSRVHFCWRL